MSYTGFKGLGIRAKTLLALAFTLGFGVSVLVLTLRGFLLNGFLQSEDKEMAQALRNVAGRVAVLLDDLAATTADFAAAGGLAVDRERPVVLRRVGVAGTPAMLGIEVPLIWHFPVIQVPTVQSASVVQELPVSSNR